MNTLPIKESKIEYLKRKFRRILKSIEITFELNSFRESFFFKFSFFFLLTLMIIKFFFLSYLLILIWKENLNLSFSDSIKSIWNFFISQTFSTVYNFKLGEVNFISRFLSSVNSSQFLIKLEEIIPTSFRNVIRSWKSEPIKFTNYRKNSFFLNNQLIPYFVWFLSSYFLNSLKSIGVSWLTGLELREDFKNEPTSNQEINFIVLNTYLTFNEIVKGKILIFFLASLFENFDTIFFPFFESSPVWYFLIVPLSIMTWIINVLISCLLFLLIDYLITGFLFPYFNELINNKIKNSKHFSFFAPIFAFALGIVRAIYSLSTYLWIFNKEFLSSFFYSNFFNFISIFNLEISKFNKMFAIFKLISIVCLISTFIWKNRKLFFAEQQDLRNLDEDSLLLI